MSKPAGGLFRHALVSCLDQALLSIPRENLPHSELRERMDVRLHEAQNPKLTGWDVFTLDYKVDFPLDVILTPVAMGEHVRISHFLWSLRRVYFVTSDCWARVMALQRARRPEMAMDLKRLQLFLSEAANLARQTNAYSLAAVRQCWEGLFTALDRPEGATSGLDYFIAAHEKLQSDLRNELFLFYNNAIKVKLAMVLSVLLRAETVVRGFERYAGLCAEHERRQSNVASMRYRSGSWSVLAEDEVVLESFAANQLKILAEQRAAFQHAARQFHAELDGLMLQLQKESPLVPAVGQLTLLLDYSGYHARRNGFDQRKYCSVPK